MTEKMFVSYEEYAQLINELVEMIKKSSKLNDVKFIYTFMRGGLPIGVHLSHFLKLPVYTDEKGIDFSTIGDKVLVVDDIADTGKTLDGFQILFPTATLFYKPKSKIKPTFYVREVPNDIWVVMPWERPDEKPNR